MNANLITTYRADCRQRLIHHEACCPGQHPRSRLSVVGPSLFQRDCIQWRNDAESYSLNLAEKALRHVPLPQKADLSFGCRQFRHYLLPQSHLLAREVQMDKQDLAVENADRVDFRGIDESALNTYRITT